MTDPSRPADPTPRPWYVDGPEFGGLWVCAGSSDRSGAVHPSVVGQSYAVLAGMGDADAALIVAAVNNYDRLRAIEAAAREYSDWLEDYVQEHRGSARVLAWTEASALRAATVTHRCPECGDVHLPPEADTGECSAPDCRKVADHSGPHFPVPGDGTPDSLRGGR